MPASALVFCQPHADLFCVAYKIMNLTTRRIAISESLANRENNLNAIRLIAAGLVLFSHCYPLSGNILREPIGHYLRIFDGGALAVIAFFFLSGYLISASWASAPHFSTFMVKRALRIFPGLAVMATFSALLLGPMMTSLDINQYFQTGQSWRYIRDNINVLSLKTNTLPGVFETIPLPRVINGSLWTLKTEFSAYILLGIIGATRLLPTRGNGLRSIIFSSVMIYLSFRLTTLSKGEFEALHIPFDFFSCQLMAVYLIGSAAFVVRDWLIRSWYLLAGLAILTWLVRETSLFAIFIYLSYGYFLLLLATSQMQLLGKGIRTHDYSYGLYIYAFPVQQTIVALNPGIAPLPLFLFALPVALTFAITSWHYVEKPSLGLKNALLGRISGRTQAR